MTRFFDARRAVFAAVLAALMPFAPAAAQEANLAHVVDPDAGFTSVSRKYPELNAPYSREGMRLRIAGIRSVKVGMSRAELQRALGRPAVGYSDGSLEFHLSLSLTGRDRLICQYRVFLDDQNTVERAVWRRPQCADLVFGRLN